MQRVVENNVERKSHTGYTQNCVHVLNRTTDKLAKGVVDAIWLNRFDLNNQSYFLHAFKRNVLAKMVCYHYQCLYFVSFQITVDSNNPPRKIAPMELNPDFILMQQGLVRVVLVLDVSGSMKVSPKHCKKKIIVKHMAVNLNDDPIQFQVQGVLNFGLVRGVWAENGSL